jgi:CRISPR-associated endonuclease/helicase Cas3
MQQEVIIVEFDSFFDSATGFAPYPYQRRVAIEGFPDLIEAPTAAGKTEAVVVPWLWRAFHGTAEVQAHTPRRLVIALPMRTLVEQTRDRITAILERLGLADEVLVRVLMGGSLKPSDLNRWRTSPHERTIVVGTIDSIVSRALNRGYGATRGAYPIDFALVTNGAQIIVDEVQLGVQATTTLRQVSAFQRMWATAEPSGLTCMSATVLPEAMDVVDNPYDPTTASVVRLTGEDERDPSLAKRLNAVRIVEELTGPGSSASIADSVLTAHVPATLTLVMVNTVKRAVDIYQALKKRKPAADLRLLHSRFRGVERSVIVDAIRAQEYSDAGQIVVSTQSLEAGVDLDARTLFTESAQWSSLVQRAGRCNRTGDQHGARLLWFSGPAAPYSPVDTAATEEALRSLEGAEVTVQQLRRMDVGQTPEDLSILRRVDMESLFETAADQAGRDIDISEYIRGGDPLDVQVAWVETSAYEDQRQRISLPPDGLRCSVPIADFRAFLGREPRPKVLVFSTTDDRWVRVSTSTQVRPQQVLLIDRQSGGYDPELGFNAPSMQPVESVDGPAALVPDADGTGADPGAGAETWVSLRLHLAETREEAETLVTAVERTTGIDRVMRAAIIGAAALHDLGKIHPVWQQALMALGEAPAEGGPFAKSPHRGRPQFMDGEQKRPSFRHELVSALMLTGPRGEQAMASAGVPAEGFDLCRYLVAAHHGIIRVHLQDPVVEGRSGQYLFGLKPGDTVPGLSGEAAAIDWELFRGGPGSWTDTSLRLLEEWGPFRLAYAEMLVRMADWRASARSHLEVTL